MRSGGQWIRRSRRTRPDLLLKRRRWQLQKPRGSHPPPPPHPRRHLRLPHQEVHLRQSQEGVPLPRPPGPPPPLHTRVALEVDNRLRVKCSLAATPQSAAGARSSPVSTPPSAKPPSSMSAGMSTVNLPTIEDDTLAKPTNMLSC